MTHYLLTESASGHPKPRPSDLDDAVNIDEAQLCLAERRAPLNWDGAGDQGKATWTCSIPSSNDKIFHGLVADWVKHLDA